MLAVDELRLPVRAVDALLVRLREVELRDQALALVETLVQPLVLTPVPAVAEQRIVLLRQPGKELLASRDGRLALKPHVTAAEREEDVPVGIDKPPAPVPLLGAEHARRLQLRTRAPAAEPVGAGDWRLWMRVERVLLGLRPRLQLVERMDLPRPVRVHELAELVHEREEGVVDLQRLVRLLAFGPHALDVKLRGRFLQGGEDDDRGDVAGLVEAVGTVLTVVAHHAGEPIAVRGHRVAPAATRRHDDGAFARAELDFPLHEPAVRALDDAVDHEIQRPVGPVGDLRREPFVAVQRDRLGEDEIHAAELVVGRNVDHGRAVLDAHGRAVERRRLRVRRGKEHLRRSGKGKECTVHQR